MRSALLAGLLLAAAAAGSASAKSLQTAIFAGGCFWCVEADMDKIDGVTKTVSGYTGGTVSNPTYKQVTSGGTGHYEAVEITFDADIVSYETLVTRFLRSIDPLDGGGQFCDRGQSYATAIFPTSDAQAEVATAAVSEAQAALGKPVKTVLQKASAFYPAEAYHQDYYQSSRVVITRFGPLTKAAAYKRYRKACGRDARVKEVWGAAAFPGS